MKILTVVGARPQFVKAAALSREIAKHPEIQEIIVHTGQHYDNNMSDIFFEEMHIPRPQYNLHIHGLSHGAMTGQMLEGIEKILQEEKPDIVLVYGDTNSTLAGALAAKKLHIKVAHVEAGLRSFNMQMPEEINRILTDRISDLLFCPTQTAIDNLLLEGIAHPAVVLSGDVMEDAALFYAEQSDQQSSIKKHLNLHEHFILATLHRAENTDNPEKLAAIVEALNQLHAQHRVIVPVHPRTRAILEKLNLAVAFTLIDPVGYFDMIQLLKHCSLVITDSGGLQKEAFFFNKFCITTREETEWVELVNLGYNQLAGANTQHIVQMAKTTWNQPYPVKQNLYGNGLACQRIVEVLIQSHLDFAR